MRLLSIVLISIVIFNITFVVLQLIIRKNNDYASDLKMCPVTVASKNIALGTDCAALTF